MAWLLTVTMALLATMQLEARRVQNTQQIFGLETLANSTQNAWERVRGHAERGAESLGEHATAGLQAVNERTREAAEALHSHAETAQEHAERYARAYAGNVAESAQDVASTAAARTQEAAAQAQEAAAKAHKKTKEAIDKMTCDGEELDYAQKTLTGMCAEKKQYDCVAGVFSTQGKKKKKAETQWVQCFDNPPFLTYGEPTCEKTAADDKTSYVLACSLCFANTSVCLHWIWWALGVVVLSLCCCCFCLGICCAAS
jgi:hypothetical protein